MIKTAVFPVAGRGSRLKPATDAVAKELLPVFDTPVLNFAIDEARDAGIERFVFVTSDDKPEIEAYVRSQRSELDVTFLTQDEPLGLGHAVLQARKIAADSPFAVILPDDLILASPPALAQMCRAYDTGLNHHMVAAMEVHRDRVQSYGILDANLPDKGRYALIEGIVEKPKPEDAPSTLAAIGRYILSPTIFETLLTTTTGANDEVQLTDAIAKDLHRMPVTAFRFDGIRFDCGQPDGLLDASQAIQDVRNFAGREAVA